MVLHYLSQRYIKKGDTVIDSPTGVQYHVLGIRGPTLICMSENLNKMAISIETAQYVSSQKNQKESTYIRYRLPLIIAPGDYIVHSEEIEEGRIMRVHESRHTVSVATIGKKNKIDSEWKIENIRPKKSDGLYM